MSTYTIGQQVHHARFGAGTIIAMDEKNMTIQYADATRSTLKAFATFVDAAAAPAAPEVIDTKHTPGPWTYSKEQTTNGHAHMVRQSSGESVANVRSHNRPTEEAQANARLIAAAPELLEALKAVLHFDSDPSIPGEYKHDITIARKVRAAIAKATGA